MDSSIILTWLETLASWIPPALSWFGLLVVVLRGAVKITPTGKDDVLVAKMDALPVIGGLLAGVASKAPIQEK